MSHPRSRTAEVVIVGGGLAGLSAAIYLGRAKRNTLVVDAGKSMARWEPEVQNYLGFPRGIAGNQLLRNARVQAKRYGVGFARDQIVEVSARHGRFHLKGEKSFYGSRRLLLATGIFHIPPDIPGVKPCLGHSMFFCKDCDGFRVQGKAVGIYGWTNESVEYALGLLLYSQCVALVTDGRVPGWDRRHQEWLREYRIPVYEQSISGVRRDGRELRALQLSDGTEIVVQALFTTRGDVLLRRIGA